MLYKCILPIILCISGVIWYVYFGSNQNNEENTDGFIDDISGIIQPSTCTFARLSDTRWYPQGAKGQATQQIKIYPNRQVKWNLNKLLAIIKDVHYDEGLNECRGTAFFVGVGDIGFTIQDGTTYTTIDWDNKSRWMPCPRCSIPY